MPAPIFTFQHDKLLIIIQRRIESLSGEHLHLQMAFSILKSVRLRRIGQKKTSIRKFNFLTKNSTKLKKMIVKSYPDDYYTEFRGRKKL